MAGGMVGSSRPGHGPGPLFFLCRRWRLDRSFSIGGEDWNRGMSASSAMAPVRPDIVPAISLSDIGRPAIFPVSPGLDEPSRSPTIGARDFEPFPVTAHPDEARPAVGHGCLFPGGRRSEGHRDHQPALSAFVGEESFATDLRKDGQADDRCCQVPPC